MERLLDTPWLLGFVLALILAGAIEAGQQVARRSRIQENPNRKDQMTAIRDGLFVLLSLLLGFTLALVAPRYAERRATLIEEAIAIETTYLRAAIMPDSYREQAQQLLRQYVDAQLDLDNASVDPDGETQAVNRSAAIQKQLWAAVTDVSKVDRTAILATYINSLNELIDLHQKHLAALENRVPRPIWLLILSIALIAVFARGLTLAARFWLTLVIAPLTIAIVVALIADLDTPSKGLIRLDQRAMLHLKADLNTAH